MVRHTRKPITQRVVDSLASQDLWHGRMESNYSGGYDFILEARLDKYTATYSPSRYGWSTIFIFDTGAAKELPLFQTIRAYLIWRFRRKEFIRFTKDQAITRVDSIFINGGV